MRACLALRSTPPETGHISPVSYPKEVAMTTKTKPPTGLAARGRRYWQTTTEAFELTDSETEILLEVCRTLDDLDRLSAAIAKNGAMVAGSAGQPVVNPALTEARGQRAILHRLVSALALPDDDGHAVPTATHTRAATAAAARWAGHVKEDGA